MAFPLTLTFPTPLGNNPTVKKLKNTNKRFRQGVVSRIKKAKRYASLTLRRQYLLPSAYQDLCKSVSHNEDIIIASVVSTCVLVYACAALATQFVLALSLATYSMSLSTGYDMGLALVVLMPVISLFCTLLLATSISFMSLALIDGANRKIYRTIRSTLRRSLALASRLTCAWLLMGLVHFVRISAIVIPLSLYVKWFSGVAVLSDKVLIAVGIAGSIWLLTGLVQFSMVPYVTMFEPQYLLTEAFKRSRQLVNKQAVVFIVTGSAVFGGYLFGLYRLCAFLRPWLRAGANLLLIVGLVAGFMLANAAMVMLYRKRKLARS